MPETISISEAERDLRGLLQSLRRDASITVVDEDGAPMATLIRAKAEAEKEANEAAMSVDEWQAAWDHLAEEVSAKWKGDKSGLDELRESRERLD